jgi:hypothetical protein
MAFAMIRPARGAKEAAVTTLHKPPAETGQVRAAPARDPRIRVSLVLAPLYLIITGLLAWWASNSFTDHMWTLEVLAGVFAVLFVKHAARAFTLWRRARR